MAIHGGDIVFKIAANDTKLNDTLNKVKSKASKFGDEIGSKISNGFNKGSSSSSKMFSKVTKGLKQIGALAAITGGIITAKLIRRTGIALKTVFNGIKTAISKAAKFATKAFAIAFAAITAGLIKLTKDTINFGDEVDKNSQKMGMSAEGYQKWSYILDICGASMENMKPAMKKLAVAAQTGNKAFSELGISQEELANLNQEQLFERTVQGLQRVESSTRRTYLANQLLGRGAMELGPVFNMSSAETEALIKRLNYLGGTMSNVAVKNCAAFKDSLTDLKMAFRGIGNVIAEYLVPLFSSFINHALIPLIVRIRQALETIFGKIPFFKKIKETFNKKTTSGIKSAAGGLKNVNSV